MLTSSTATLGRLTAPHREGHATPSPDFFPLERSQIVPDYVPAGVKVSIERVTTMFTNKVRLVNSVRTGNISTPATLLRTIASINIDNLYSLALSFILYKLLKLGKVPAVYPASILFISFNFLPDTFELFKDNYSASRNKANYFLSYFVIYMPPKPFLLLRKFFEMSFGRRSAFGGKSFSKGIIPLRYSSYVSSIKKFVHFSISSRYYCKFSETKINSDIEINRFYIWNFFFNSNVQKKLFESLIIFEVSRSNFPVQVLLEIIRNSNFKLLSSFNGRKRYFFSIQPNSIASFIITNSGIFAFWTPAFESFSFSLDCRLETFGSYDPCRDYKLRRERGFVPNGVVSELVEFNPVPELSFPTNFTGIVVSKLILLNGFKKYLLLLFGRFENKLNSPLQSHIAYLDIVFTFIYYFNSNTLSSAVSSPSLRKESPTTRR